RRRHTRCYRDWSSDVCSSDLPPRGACSARLAGREIDSPRLSQAQPHFLPPIRTISSNSCFVTGISDKRDWRMSNRLLSLEFARRSEERRVGKGCWVGVAEWSG